MNEIDELVQQLHNREWLSKLLLRTRSKPIWIGLLVAVVNLIITISIAAYTETLQTSSAGIGFLADYTTWSFLFLFCPALFGSYCWLQTASQQLFGQLVSDGSLELTSDLREPLAKLRNRLHSKWLPLVAILLGIVQSALSVKLTQISKQMWSGSHPLNTWSRLPMDFLMFYILVIGVYDFIVMLIALSDIFRQQEIRVQPYHPDKAGGMGAVGRFVANTGYSIAPVAITIMLLSLQVPDVPTSLYRIVIIVIPVFYLIMAPTCFFVPLWSAHSAMLEYRDQRIKNISDEFNSTYAKLTDLQSRETGQVKQLLEKIHQLDEEREIIYRFPVWPFNSANIRKFFGLVLSPLVPVITSLIINLLSKLF